MQPSGAGAATAAEAGRAASCANCGAALHGRYCHACGQDAETRIDSLRGFLRENLSDIAHVDSRGLRTLRDLFLRPGRLTAAYFDGHRVRYLLALQIYLVTAARFFFTNSVRPFIVADGETMSVLATLGPMTISEDMSAEERRPLEQRGVTSEHFEDRIREVGNNQLPAFLIAVVAAFALLVALFHVLRERNLLKHLVFALHWTSFFLMLMIVERAFGGEPGDPTLLGLVLSLLGIAWLTVALRRTYGQLWAIALPKAIVLFLLFNLLLSLWVGGVLAWAIATL